jgi:hypothetical protein
VPKIIPKRLGMAFLFTVFIEGIFVSFVALPVNARFDNVSSVLAPEAPFFCD